MDGYGRDIPFGRRPIGERGRMGKGNTKNLIVFVAVCMAIIFGWNFLQKEIWPPPAPTPKQLAKDARKYIGFMGGGPAVATTAATEEAAKSDALTEFQKTAKAIADAKPKPPPKPVAPKPVGEFVDLGNKDFFLQVRLTNVGAAVDRVIVTHFKHADEMGLHDKSHESLNLIRAAGDRTPSEDEYASADDDLGSFLMYHYARPSDDRPVETLGTQRWELLSKSIDPNADHQEAIYATALREMGVRIVKTFSLEKKQYHIGLTVRIEPLPGEKPKDFRYQLSGSRGEPIEGKWYAGVYRNAMFGWVENGSAKRYMEDAATIHNNLGSETKVSAAERRIVYAAGTTQYFASALCVDDQQGNTDFIERACATAEGSHPKDKPQFGDITPRMVSKAQKFESGPVEHKYLLYHGPIKVRLLKQFRDPATAVDPDLVERYAKTLTLETMTDHASETMIGRFASSIGWTDVTILTTNAMHWVLGQLRRVIPVPGLTIIILTLIVRAFLWPLSRRQQANMAKMQDKMKALQPELKKLEEEYKGKDQQEFQQKKMKVMMANGVNPMSQLGGCLLMFAQMPIFMGLYYCLMENVFFRLESFLWIPNLSAPDMLFKFGEIPYISDPANIGSTFYLGPYFNLLPIIAVSFMFVQQKLFTPPPTDEQQRMQQSMFKYMMIFMGFIFYKVAAGLCIYFITSSLWGLAERKLLPKPKPAAEVPAGKGGKGSKGRALEPEKGWLGKQTDKLGDMWKKLLDAAEKK
jgi:YidC/Oxa1 family membrane protein insertase